MPTRGVERWLSQTLAATLGASRAPATGSRPTFGSRSPQASEDEGLAVATRIRSGDRTGRERVRALRYVTQIGLVQEFLMRHCGSRAAYSRFE